MIHDLVVGQTDSGKFSWEIVVSEAKGTGYPDNAIAAPGTERVVCRGVECESEEAALDDLFGIFFGSYGDSFLGLYQDWFSGPYTDRLNAAQAINPPRATKPADMLLGHREVAKQVGDEAGRVVEVEGEAEHAIEDVAHATEDVAHVLEKVEPVADAAEDLGAMLAE